MIISGRIPFVKAYLTLGLITRTRPLPIRLFPDIIGCENVFSLKICVGRHLYTINLPIVGNNSFGVLGLVNRFNVYSRKSSIDNLFPVSVSVSVSVVVAVAVGINARFVRRYVCGV
jgi:hypothetical protein